MLASHPQHQTLLALIDPWEDEADRALVLLQELEPDNPPFRTEAARVEEEIARVEAAGRMAPVGLHPE